MGLEGQLAPSPSPSKGFGAEAGVGGWDAPHMPPAHPLLLLQTGNNSRARSVPGKMNPTGLNVWTNPSKYLLASYGG